ncbi:MAG: DoxX family membrane protein [Acidobacteria bacterium]|nr:DoxX family membrane protein [Acidobacteriota bacterium]
MPLRVLSIALGVFLLFMGLDKLEWFLDSGFLARRLQEWRGTARPIVRWYLDTIAIPGVPVFARLVPLAEFAAATALILGTYVRLAAALTMLMIINIHFAADIIFRYDYLINPYGVPILGGLLALALGGKKLPQSLSRK